MARKVNSGAPAPAAPDAAPLQDGADDLAILHPEREATIAGERIVMREYGFVEGLRLQPLVQPILDGLADTALRDGHLDVGAAARIFALHDEAIVTLIARACDRDEAWVQQLSDADGQALLFLWWETNLGFFVRRVGQVLTARAIEAVRQASASAGATSMPSSSPTGT
ncbi:MAG TPA: DUF6631 family protein, partial [Mizugakiibacter sp.]